MADLSAWLGGSPHATAIETHDGRVWDYATLAAEIDERARAAETVAGTLASRVLAITAKDDLTLLLGVLVAWRLDATPWLVGTSSASVAQVGPAAFFGDEGPQRAGGTRALEAGLVLTTSGSTGTPKHVVLEHAGLSANVDAILGYLPVMDAPRTGVLVPLSYGYGLVGQALTTLRAGGTLLLLRGASAFAAQQRDALLRFRAQGLSSVPTQLRALCELGPLDLRYVASAGAPLDAATAEAMRRACPNARRFNQYGLTEASPRVSALEDVDDPEAFLRGGIGSPLEGVELRTDADEEHSAELFVRGPNVMREYLDDPEGTRAVLDAEGWLRTGDRVFRDARGRLFPAGRADDVVKVAGERVSLVRVGAAFEDAGECVVCAVSSPRSGLKLVAFVVGDLARARTIARSLPDAWRPSKLVGLASLPKTERGKVDHALLRSWAVTGGPTDAGNDVGDVEARAPSEGRSE